MIHRAEKSVNLGNSIDPLLVIDEYGADALRFTLATGILREMICASDRKS